MSDTLQLASNLGMSVVAEGVETKEQYLLLKSLFPQQMQSQIQSFIFSRPLNKGDIFGHDTEIIERWNDINTPFH